VSQRLIDELFSTTGTIDNPIMVNGAGDEQYAGCTGYPVDSHQVNWLTV
jgi:cytochrome c oxidase subunit 5b